MSGLGSRLSTDWPKKVQGSVVSTPQPIQLISLSSPSHHLDLNRKGGVKSGRSGAHNPSKLCLSCKANKCSGVGTGDLGGLTIP